MSTDENNGEETVIPKEGEGEETPPAPTSKDPLDAIEDEAERAEAKRLRAIQQRLAKKGDEFGEEPKLASDPSNYATKDDLKVLATNDARKLVAPEVLEAWDELTKIPLGGYNPLDSGSIAENMKQRFVLYQQSNAAGSDPAKDLTASNVTAPSGKAPVKPAGSPKEPSSFKEPVEPKDWY